jgi:hypothetical protein
MVPDLPQTLAQNEHSEHVFDVGKLFSPKQRLGLRHLREVGTGDWGLGTGSKVGNNSQSPAGRKSIDTTDLCVGFTVSCE